MTMADYRRPRSESSGMPWMDDLKREVASELAAQVRELQREVSALRAQIAGKSTNVNVAPPAVSVAAPSVQVAAPSVNSPVTVEVDLDELHATMAAVVVALKENTAALKAPVTRTVHRDADKLVKTMTEKRG